MTPEEIAATNAGPHLRPTLAAFNRLGICTACGARDSYYLDAATSNDGTEFQCVECGRCVNSMALPMAQRDHRRTVVARLLHWLRGGH